MEQEAQIDADPGLILDKLDAWIDGFFRLVPNIAVAAIVLALFIGLGFATAWTIRRSTRSRDRSELGLVAGGVAKWLVWGFGLLLALTVVTPSLRPGDLIAGLGLGSVAVGFAFKDILQNLLAGVLILIRQPFRVGDQIIVGDSEGTILHIEARATMIRTYDGRRAVVPNTDVYNEAVLVNTAWALRRSEYEFPIARDADSRAALRLALEAARTVDGVADDPAPDAQLTDIGDFAKRIRLRWWTGSTRIEVVRISSEVLLAVEDAFAEGGIEIPFPVRRVLLQDDTGRAPTDGPD